MIESVQEEDFSDAIRRCRDGVIRNPYQGNDKKVLFVCSMGILRSATAARIYARKYNTRTAGSWPDALVKVTPTLLAWADEVVFVNQENYNEVVKNFPGAMNDTRVVVLNIPDNYKHMDKRLVQAFEDQYEPITS